MKKLLLVTAVFSLLQGCASFDIGESEYGCSGMPVGVRCMSTRSVYEATNNGALLTAKTPRETAAESTVAVDTSRAQDPLYRRYVAPNIPDAPIPIRTPTQVMRIWIAPFENDLGDLQITGTILTDIEPRRWVIGTKPTLRQDSIKPLQVIAAGGESKK